MGETGDPAVMMGTSGAAPGTSGVTARYEARTMLAIVALSLINNIVNVATILTDRAEDALPTVTWYVWLNELSSWVGFALMLPLVRRAAHAFRPPRLPWAAAPLAHLPAAMLFSAGHVAIMLAIREMAHAAAGHRYDFFGDSPAGTLIYEFRKDVVFYTAVLLVLLLVRALAESRRAPAPILDAAPRIEVRDGSRTVWLQPDEVISAEAAGNYVELSTATGSLLHRATLASMEAQLGDAFVRVHRSRLVRRDGIREVRGLASGDFEIVLADGRAVAGSRRYRDRLRT